MNSFVRRTVPAALVAGAAMMVASGGAAGAQVPLPGAGGLPAGGAESLTGAPSALCSGPLSALNSLSGVCEVAGEDQVEIGGAGQVLPRAGAQESQGAEASSEAQYPVNVQLNGEEEPPGCEPGDECEVPEDGDCVECPPTTETTVPTTETTVPTTDTTAPPETTVLETTPTSQVAAQPPAGEELPRTGSTVAPFVVAGAALVAVGAALVASRRFALGRRG